MLHWFNNSCVYTRGHMCIYVEDMKFLWSNLWLGGLSTDNDDDTRQCWHMMDNSWLHRLISIYAEWATELTFHFANVCTRNVLIFCVSVCLSVYFCVSVCLHIGACVSIYVSVLCELSTLCMGEKVQNVKF